MEKLKKRLKKQRKSNKPLTIVPETSVTVNESSMAANGLAGALTIDDDMSVPKDGSHDRHEPLLYDHESTENKKQKNVRKRIAGDVNDEADLEFDSKSVTTMSSVAVSMQLADIKRFDFVFWLLVWNCSILYAVVLSWMNVGGEYLQTTYGYSHGTANSILTIPYSLAAVFQPIWGWISDKYGKRSQMLVLSSLLMVAAHYMLGWIVIDGNPIYIPIIALTLLGFGYSIFTAVVWPCFPLVVPPHTIGTAYGIPVSGYNLVCAFYFFLVGVFTLQTDTSDKYIDVQWFLLGTAVSALVTSLWLLYADYRTGYRLNEPAYSTAN